MKCFIFIVLLCSSLFATHNQYIVPGSLKQDTTYIDQNLCGYGKWIKLTWSWKPVFNSFPNGTSWTCIVWSTKPRIVYTTTKDSSAIDSLSNCTEYRTDTTIYYLETWNSVAGIHDTSTLCTVIVNNSKIEQKQINLNFNFSIYPNPCNNILSIVPIQQGIISIYNIHGQLINRFANPKSIINQNMSNYSNGIYLIKAQTKSETYIKQILLQK